jgi:sugar lactone lactonase YvrE
MIRADVLVEPVVHHGEGPTWDDAEQSLYWVDMLAGDVLTIDHGTVTRRHVGKVAAVVRPRVDGGHVVGTERNVLVVDQHWSPLRQFPDLFDDPGVRLNEGGCDPQGRFYCGSMAYDESPGAGTLYRIDPDGTATVVLRDVTISNGLDWSPDGSTVYYVDSATQGIDAFDFDPATGEFANRRRLLSIPSDVGSPDGLTVDSGGLIWVALWDGAAVHCYTPAGRLEDVVELPTRRVTACTFGGPGLDELFISTSALGVKDDPLAGALFHALPGVTGRAARRYRG